MEKRELGIYVHIPFCKRKCYYCDFISYDKEILQVDTYIQEVIKEMSQYDITNYNVTTIYIGGGTPSFIDEKYIVELLEKLKEKLKNNDTKFEEIEITIEINPGTITCNKLEKYKMAGINRISIGMQSTNDELLREIGRIHNYKQFLETYELARKVGFENINIDLMIGLPNQTILDLKQCLEEIKKLSPEHVSVYSLIVEEGTMIDKLLNSGKLQLPSEDLERKMYWYMKNTLELNGYKHYEISNFAKEKRESKHNLNCWEQKEYIGLGIAAHSYLNGIRYSNTDIIKDMKWNCTKKKIEEKQDLEDKKKEYMLLGLRKIEGISIKRFKEKYIDNPIILFHKELEKLVKQNLLEINGDKIQLTSKGLDLANLVWEEFV